jgi:hypothetical protein
MPNYMVRVLELLNPERLRQCSIVMPDYMIRFRATTSRASERVQQPEASLHDKRVRDIISRASESVQQSDA